MATATQSQSLPRTEERAGSRRATHLNWATVRTYLGVAVIVIWGLAPAFWMVVTSFRPIAYTFETSPLPTHWTLDNYRTAFSTKLGNHFGQDLLNSLIIGVAVTVVAMAAGVFCAYALARLEFRGKYVLLGLILGASMFPAVALVSPLFQLFTNIHWIGKYQALIILPLAAPGLFTTAILAFIAAWNEFLLASQLSSEKTQPVTVAIANFTGSQPHQEPYTAIMAAGTIITIPLILMVLLLQRKIVAGLTAGSVKG